MAEFIKGMKLAESFFEEAARPLLASRYPGLSYSAGLLGFGSDVLGYDDFTSCDHMWGPRFYLFLAPEDIGKNFERKILVIWADRMAAAVKQKLQGTVFEEMPLIGSLSEVANFTALTEQSQLRRNIADFYDSLAQKRQR